MKAEASQEQTTHDFTFYHCVASHVRKWNFKTPHFVEGEFYKYFSNVERFSREIAAHSEYNPKDRSVLERWFVVMERKAQTDEQRGDLGDLKSRFVHLLADTSQSSGKADEVATPDFSHMESYTPTQDIDMSALYAFLIDESVVADVDEKLFANCISHAHINELWNSNYTVKKRKRNLLQCLFKMLASRYPQAWADKCAKNLIDENLIIEKKNILNPTTSKRTVEFEDKLRRVLNKKTIK